MAQTLIDRFTSHFDHSKYEDKYRKRLLKIVKQKSRGEEVHAPAREKQEAQPDLLEALRASVDAAKGAKNGRSKARRSGGAASRRQRAKPRRRELSRALEFRLDRRHRPLRGLRSRSALRTAFSAACRRSSASASSSRRAFSRSRRRCLLLLRPGRSGGLFGRFFDGAGAMPANDENPTASSSSVKAPRASASRASSSATALRRRSRTRRRIASVGGFPRGATCATATSASRSSAVSRSARAPLNASGLFPTCVFLTLRAAFAASRAACGRSRAARLTARTTAEGFRRAATAAASSGRSSSRSFRASWSRSATNSSGAAASSFSASFGTSTVIAMQPQGRARGPLRVAQDDRFVAVSAIGSENVGDDPLPVASAQRVARRKDLIGEPVLRVPGREPDDHRSRGQKPFDTCAHRTRPPSPETLAEPKPPTAGSNSTAFSSNVAERRRSRTDRAVGCTTALVLKTSWATGPMPLRRAG